MNLLTAKNITKKFVGHTALNNINFKVPKGSISGLLGPNGAGKTTLIRIINQITFPDKGQIFLEKELLNPSHIAQIGYLPEERGLYKKMKVGEQALYLAQLKGLNYHKAKNELKNWFNKFEIENWWDKKVEELSKGMAQKIQFIVTILHKPKLLIFDEPFSGFDPINADLIKNEIINLNKDGATIIFSTHRMESIEELCNHITLINNSKKILDGYIENIRSEFKSNSYSITYKPKRERLENNLIKVIKSEKTSGVYKDIIKIASSDSANIILQHYLNFSEVKQFSEKLPSVNDIFIEAVQNKNNE